jgi:hypothetical protein
LKAGGAALGLAVLVLSDSPAALLALLGVALVVVGGTAWTGVRGSSLTRLLAPLVVVVLARVAAGPAAAGIAALLLALGALLRVRIEEGVVGLSVFGGAVALSGGASFRLALGFWVAGLAIIALRAAANRVRRVLQRGLSGLRHARPPSPS